MANKLALFAACLQMLLYVTPDVRMDDHFMQFGTSETAYNGLL